MCPAARYPAVMYYPVKFLAENCRPIRESLHVRPRTYIAPVHMEALRFPALKLAIHIMPCCSQSGEILPAIKVLHAER